MTDFDKRRAYAARSARATARRAGQAQCFDVLRACYEAQQKARRQDELDRRRGAHVRELLSKYPAIEWRCQDGSRVPSSAMADDHLHFAIATLVRSGRRGGLGHTTLQVEALRRVLG